MSRPKPEPRTYSVSGRGRFPLDMLRYDCSWPARSEDAHTIRQAVAAHSGHATVQLRSHRAPTASRWDSFGWEVAED